MKIWMRGFLIFCLGLITLFLPWSHWSNGYWWEPASLLQTLSVGNPLLIFCGMIFLIGTALTFWTTIGGFVQIIGSMGFLMVAKFSQSTLNGSSEVFGLSLGAMVGTLVGWIWVYYFMRYRIIEVVPTEDHLWPRLVDEIGYKIFGDGPDSNSSRTEVYPKETGPAT